MQNIPQFRRSHSQGNPSFQMNTIIFIQSNGSRIIPFSISDIRKISNSPIPSEFDRRSVLKLWEMMCELPVAMKETKRKFLERLHEYSDDISFREEVYRMFNLENSRSPVKPLHTKIALVRYRGGPVKPVLLRHCSITRIMIRALNYSTYFDGVPSLSSFLGVWLRFLLDVESRTESTHVSEFHAIRADSVVWSWTECASVLQRMAIVALVHSSIGHRS